MHFFFFLVKKGAERELIIYLFLPISGQIGIIYLFFCQLKVRLAFFATLGREPLILFVFGPNWLLVFEIAPLRTRFTSYLGLGGTPSPKIGTIWQSEKILGVENATRGTFWKFWGVWNATRGVFAWEKALFPQFCPVINDELMV